MAYLDVASGVVVQAGETVSAVAVLEDTVLAWPAPVPAVMLTGRPAHRLIFHDLVASTSVVLVPPLAVPASPVPVPRSSVSDRKSTRLNSSHGYISYAVFCL